MATSHDRMASQCLRVFLHKFRSGEWENNKFSKDLVLGRTNKDWPSEDGNIYDSINNTSIALEFKPEIESKRGIQTGLGQCITYLERYSSSYYLCPRIVEDFAISEFMKSVFENSIQGKVPVGLIEHFQDPITKEIELKMLVDIAPGLSIPGVIASPRESRYWAKFIDTNPHLVYLLLKIAEDLDYHESDRDHVIWKLFFDRHYLPKQFRNLNPYESKINHWGIRFMEPYKQKKIQLKEMVKRGDLTTEEAELELESHCSHEGRPRLTNSTQNDNLYKSYKKNYLKAIDHLELWDSNCYLTNIGKQYVNTGDVLGPDSLEMSMCFGKLFLEHGNHFDLITDLDKSVQNKSFDSEREARIHSQQFMESHGLYKRNHGRAVTQGSTKIFQNEFQLWRKLNILPVRNSYVPHLGYQFDWEKIDEYLNFKL